jgi:hypothetical protein
MKFSGSMPTPLGGEGMPPADAGAQLPAALIGSNERAT